MKLMFPRSTQFPWKAGKNKAHSGTRIWIWDAFLAFLCGVDWDAPNREALNLAAQKSLKEVAESELGNFYVEFEEKDDDWILIKP